jgi:hypothetical protein
MSERPSGGRVGVFTLVYGLTVVLLLEAKWDGENLARIRRMTE